jgi:hypothetical protein
MSSKFVVVFDGWSEGSHYYVGVAAACMKSVNGKDVAVQMMLSMQPLLMGFEKCAQRIILIICQGSSNPIVRIVAMCFVLWAIIVLSTKV